MSIVASNPAIVRHCERSPIWSLMAAEKTGNNKQTLRASGGKERAVSLGRMVMSFEYVGAVARSSIRVGASDACDS